MLGRNLAFLLALSLFSFSAGAADLGHSVSGDSETEDLLGKSTEAGTSPYIINGESANNVENSKANGEDFTFNSKGKVNEKIAPKKKYEDFGYTVPGSFENQENYIETDKIAMAKDFRKNATGSMNITFLKNSYSYESTNDVINRTISTGAKSVKGGNLYIRNDSYILKTDLMNVHWSIGGGIGYNSGKGFFIDGKRSDTTFNLWEVPLDGGVGLEIPVTSWIKLSGTAGPSLMGLMQNRSDYQAGEKGKRKFQVSPGYFANAQFKFNLSNIGQDTAYDLFTASEITNLFMNIEARMQNYSNFQDDIKVSGTSFGIGFTFEYL